jgi:hypothetical protein
VRRDGTTYSGTRGEVLAALSDDREYHQRFGTPATAQAADTAITCVVGGSQRVSVGQFTYDVTDEQPIA